MYTYVYIYTHTYQLSRNGMGCTPWVRKIYKTPSARPLWRSTSTGTAKSQICTAELEKHVEDHEGIHNHGLVVQMMKTLDVDGDGKASSQELAVLAI